jgi:hypothetical protein
MAPKPSIFAIYKKCPDISAGRVSCQARESSSWDRGLFGPFIGQPGNASLRGRSFYPHPLFLIKEVINSSYAQEKRARLAEMLGVLVSHNHRRLDKGCRELKLDTGVRKNEKKKNDTRFWES